MNKQERQIFSEYASTLSNFAKAMAYASELTERIKENCPQLLDNLTVGDEQALSTLPELIAAFQTNANAFLKYQNIA